MLEVVQQQECRSGEGEERRERKGLDGAVPLHTTIVRCRRAEYASCRIESLLLLLLLLCTLHSSSPQQLGRLAN